MALPRLETMSVAVDGNIGIVKFNRPKHANALNAQVMPEMLKALSWALDEPQVKVVVFTGEGRFYTAGLDLLDVAPEGPVIPDEGVEVLRETHNLLINAEKVLIAAVNGPGVGWGTSSIALFDLVYSVPDAVFFTPFIKWGLCAEACSSVSFQRIMGRQKAASLILAGERMTPQELEAAGLISKILPKEDFFDAVIKIARRIADQPTGALKYNKNLMMAPIRGELLAANERECQGLRERSRTAEPREAIAAFKAEQDAKKKAKL